MEKEINRLELKNKMTFISSYFLISVSSHLSSNFNGIFNKPVYFGGKHKLPWAAPEPHYY